MLRNRIESGTGNHPNALRTLTGGLVLLVAEACGGNTPATPTPIRTPETTPSSTPTLLITPSPEVTPMPTAIPTLEITLPPTPTETPTPIPTASATEKPSTSNMPEVTATPLSELEQTIKDFDQEKTQIKDRWVDQNLQPLNFGLRNTQESPMGREYRGYIVGAERLGENNVILIIGMEDVAGNRYTVPFRVSNNVGLPVFVGNSSPGVDSEIFYSGQPTPESPDYFYQRVLDGTYLDKAIKFYNWDFEENSPSGYPDVPETVKLNVPAAKELFNYAKDALTQNSKNLKKPSFVDTIPTDYHDIPMIAQISVRDTTITINN